MSPKDHAVAALESTRSFWNSSPCNGQSTLEARRRYRYTVEPYLPETARRIASRHAQVVEVGCGMGTDAFNLCAQLPEHGRYLGLDYSPDSIAAAEAAVAEAGQLKVRPSFRVANAEALDLESGSVECVYSMGVLHHTAHPQRAIDEIMRVLQPGGRAYVYLYRTWGPKVMVAKALRAIQRLLDAALGRERCLYALVKGYHFERFLGTAVLECFGVPHLDCYDEVEMRRMFSDFRINELYPVGYSLPWLHSDTEAKGPLGYFWFIEVEKVA
jgi:SAM-dependent methyltransferase